jgi:hypothetical protein
MKWKRKKKNMNLKSQYDINTQNFKKVLHEKEY